MRRRDFIVRPSGLQIDDELVFGRLRHRQLGRRTRADKPNHRHYRLLRARRKRPYGSRATKKQLALELADTVICADRVAMYEGIDLGAAVREAFNDKSAELGLKARIEPTPDTEIEAAKQLLKAHGYHVYPKERVVDVRVGHKIPLDELTGFTLGEELLIKHHKQTMAVEIGRYLYDDNDIVWQQRRDSDMGLCIQGTVRLVKPKPENET